MANLPLVSSAYGMVSTAYASTKESHPYVKSVCDVAEKGVRTLTAAAVSGAQPILTKLEPQSEWGWGGTGSTPWVLGCPKTGPSRALVRQQGREKLFSHLQFSPPINTPAKGWRGWRRSWGWGAAPREFWGTLKTGPSRVLARQQDIKNRLFSRLQFPPPTNTPAKGWISWRRSCPSCSSPRRR